MRKLEKVIEKSIDGIRLVVRTARTARTGISAHIEVYNGKLLFSDEVKLGKDAERRKFAKRVVETVPKADTKAIYDTLLEFGPEVERAVTESEKKNPTPTPAACPGIRPTHVPWTTNISRYPQIFKFVSHFSLVLSPIEYPPGSGKDNSKSVKLPFPHQKSLDPTQTTSGQQSHGAPPLG